MTLNSFPLSASTGPWYFTISPFFNPLYKYSELCWRTAVLPGGKEGTRGGEGPPRFGTGTRGRFGAGASGCFGTGVRERFETGARGGGRWAFGAIFAKVVCGVVVGFLKFATASEIRKRKPGGKRSSQEFLFGLKKPLFHRKAHKF